MPPAQLVNPLYVSGWSTALLCLSLLVALAGVLRHGVGWSPVEAGQRQQFSLGVIALSSVSYLIQLYLDPRSDFPLFFFFPLLSFLQALLLVMLTQNSAEKWNETKPFVSHDRLESIFITAYLFPIVFLGLSVLAALQFMALSLCLILTSATQLVVVVLVSWADLLVLSKVWQLRWPFLSLRNKWTVSSHGLPDFQFQSKVMVVGQTLVALFTLWDVVNRIWAMVSPLSAWIVPDALTLTHFAIRALLNAEFGMLMEKLLGLYFMDETSRRQPVVVRIPQSKASMEAYLGISPSGGLDTRNLSDMILDATLHIEEGVQSDTESEPTSCNSLELTEAVQRLSDPPNLAGSTSSEEGRPMVVRSVGVEVSTIAPSTADALERPQSAEVMDESTDETVALRIETNAPLAPYTSSAVEAATVLSAGTSSTLERVYDAYYTTPPSATEGEEAREMN